MMKLTKVKIAQLKSASYNPKHRTSKGIERLSRSIEEMGLLVPIIVSADNDVIDGHRRIAAFRQLKIEEIPALIAENEDRDKIYAEVNVTQATMSGADALYVWYHNPKATTAKQQSMYAAMEEAIGRKLVKSMVDQNLSIRIWKFARRLANFCGSDDADFLTDATRWVINFGYNRQLESALATNTVRADFLRACVKNGKPVKMSFVAK